MSTSFPGGYDTFTNPTSTDTLDSPSHSQQHADANDAIEAIEARVGASGTAFPGSPSSGDRFYRTDRKIEYFYDGTRWLSVHLYRMDLGGLTNVSAAAALERHATWKGDYDMWLVDYYYMTYVNAPNNASNHWAYGLYKDFPNTLITEPNTASDSASTWYSRKTALNQLLSGYETLFIQTGKGGAPGTTYAAFSVTYRLVG